MDESSKNNLLANCFQVQRALFWFNRFGFCGGRLLGACDLMALGVGTLVGVVERNTWDSHLFRVVIGVLVYVQ